MFLIGPATCTRSTRRPASRSGRSASPGERRRGRQGSGYPDRDRRQGDRRHPRRHPLRGRSGGKVLAFDKFTGALLWSTTADAHPAAIITQSATVYNGKVYVGVASQEEALAAFVPGYVLSFRGSMLALDLQHGCDRVEDVHGPRDPSGLHRQRCVGELAGDRHQAQPGLHRDWQQLLRPRRRSAMCWRCSRRS